MKSLIDGLPPEIARQVHPDCRKNEQEYWAQRDQLLARYRDQWVGFADGSVIASGTSPVEVFHAAMSTGRHPYVTCVGHELEPDRIRRASFPYDTTYPGEPLPLTVVEFRKDPQITGIVLDRVIPDTGADASSLPWSDCLQLTLDPGSGVQRLMSGVGQTALPTLAFQVWVSLDGNTYPCRLLADFSGHERILGRDVLNRLDALFRGPAREVVVNP
jgi:hypothetical protein